MTTMFPPFYDEEGRMAWVKICAEEVLGLYPERTRFQEKVFVLNFQSALNKHGLEFENEDTKNWLKDKIRKSFKALRWPGRRSGADRNPGFRGREWDELTKIPQTEEGRTAQYRSRPKKPKEERQGSLL